MNILPIQPDQEAVAKDQAGFTIIELLIATLIFSLVLIMLTFGILQITRAYYKGVTEASTQNSTRNIINTISQAVQFSGDSDAYIPIQNAADGSRGFCIGSQRYSYLLGYQLVDGTPASGTNQTNHAFLEDAMPANCSSTTSAQSLKGSSFTTTSKELMGLKMRLVAFTQPTTTLPTGGLYPVHVRIVYGDDDLLCSPAANDCASPDNNFPYTTIPDDLTCKGQAGSQFCAVSDLSTTVQKRIQ